MKCWTSGGLPSGGLSSHHRKDSLPMPLPPPKPGVQVHDGSHWRIKPPRMRSFNMLAMIGLLTFIVYKTVTLQSFYIDDPSDQQFVKEPDHYAEPWNDGADINMDKIIEMRLIPESDVPPVQQLNCPRLPADQSLNVQINMEALWKVVSRRAIDNTIIITFASGSQSLLLRNWLCSLKRQGVRNFVVIAFDLETANIVDSVCGPGYSFYDVAMLQGKKVNWEREDSDQEFVWRQIMAFKVATVRAILRLGINLLVTDADTVVIKNPFDGYVPTSTSCNLQFQADKKDMHLLSEYRGIKAFNCGVYYAKSDPVTLRLYQIWSDAFNCKAGFREQRSLHIALEALTEGQDYILYDGEKEKPFMYDWQLEELPASASHTMRLCYLNPKHFPNGGLFFNDIDLFRQTHGESVPVIVHANYMKGKQERKKLQLQHKGSWFLNEDLTCPPKRMHRKPNFWQWLKSLL